MLNSEEAIAKINLLLKKEYENDDGWVFPKDNEESLLFKSEYLKKIKRVLAKKANRGIIDALSKLTEYSIRYSLYSSIFQNEEKSLKLFSKAANYSFITLVLGSNAYKCKDIINPFIMMESACEMCSLLSIAGWEDEYNKCTEILINSINSKNGIIDKGVSHFRISWYLLELYARINNITIDTENAFYPDNMYPYNEAIKLWDTESIVDVNRLVYLLAEVHLELSMWDDDEVSRFSSEVHQVSDPFMQLFPYEILTWLKLREYAGLENPQEFTHPLMNTSIAKMFLELKTPLPKSKELPYAAELIAKLKEVCPEIDQSLLLSQSLLHLQRM